ncbi:MAG TPA: AraC family transcriptional regulator, partial [Candidatus Nanopelagicales bacterium]|nr:AraC family transcriptional regulator [Candidatus Nanopelagicales bacterium]
PGPGERGVMLNPGAEGRNAWRAGLRTLNVIVEQGALSAHLSALTGTTLHAPPRFKLPVDLRRGPGADVHRIVQLLHEASTRTEGAPASPHLLAHLREALYVGLLFGVESTVNHLLHRTPPPASLRAVRQAEEYLTAHASEPIAIADLAALTGVGLRSLQRAFRSARGMSLRAFLTSARLDLARRLLQAAGPGTTVTQVLHASGFGHPGEFSAAYRRRFGESPSETLRRALGGRAERR